MALHKDFPQSPHAVLDPGIRCFPEQTLGRGLRKINIPSAAISKENKMDNNCTKCGNPDTGILNNYKPPTGKTFTCSRCVIKMIQEKEENKNGPIS